MNRKAAAMCRTETRRICANQGSRFSMKVYRAVKEAYNHIPRPHRNDFTINLTNYADT